MGNSVTQNCQRGLVFFTFLHCTFFFIVTVINLCKNRIDPCEEDDEAAAEKYKQGQDKDKEKPKPKKKEELGKEQDSQVQFDQKIIQEQEQKIEEDDPAAIKFVKKNMEYELSYFPLLMVFILNIVTGTSKAFCFVDCFFTIFVVLLFNVLKVHRQCCNTKVGNVMMENLWLAMIFFGFINHWGAFTVKMPYIVV